MPPNPTTGPTPAEPVKSFRIQDATYESRLINCGKPSCRRCNSNGVRKPSHGPYWYLCYTKHGKTCRVYLGKTLDTARFRNDQGLIDLGLIAEYRRAQADRVRDRRASRPYTKAAADLVDVGPTPAPDVRPGVATRVGRAIAAKFSRGR